MVLIIIQSQGDKGATEQDNLKEKFLSMSLHILCFPGPFQQYRTLDWSNALQPDASSLLYLTDNTTSLTDKHLNPIRDNLGKQWKNCARKLGFSESQIDEIDHDYERDGLKEKVYQMLQKWLMREGIKGATVGKLAQALHQCCRKDLLNHLIRASRS